MDPPGWPSWWRWLRRVDVLTDGDENGIGARHRLFFGTALPYTLSVETQVVRSLPTSFLETRASGELAGSGVWELSDDDADTLVRYTWVVETTKRWMNAIAPVARPAFSWNHDVLMKGFARGFADVLGARLVSVHNRTVKPASADFGRLPGAPAE